MTSKLVKIEDLFDSIYTQPEIDWAMNAIGLYNNGLAFDIITFLDNLYSYGMASTTRQRDYVLWGTYNYNVQFYQSQKQKKPYNPKAITKAFSLKGLTEDDLIFEDEGAVVSDVDLTTKSITIANKKAHKAYIEMMSQPKMKKKARRNHK